MILIALNDDPTGSDPRQYEDWNEFFAQVDDAHEIEARVMCGVQVSDDFMDSRVWRTVEIVGAYDEWAEELECDQRTDAAHRSAHMSDTL